MTVRAVILDLDGTLVDSEPVLRRAQMRALLEFGHEVPESRVTELVGVQFLASKDVPGRLDRLQIPIAEHEAIDARYRQIVGPMAKSIPGRAGAAALLESLSARAIPIAIVTNRTQAGATELIGRFAWSGLIDFVVARDSPGARPKPSPESVVLAIRRFGVRPRLVGYIGDSTLDMRSASAAGCGVIIGLAAETAPDDLTRAGATTSVPSLMDAIPILLARTSDEN